MLTALRTAFRPFSRRPGLSLLAVLVLALGLGAASSLISLLDHLLLNPVPYPQAERLVAVWRKNQDFRHGQFNGYQFQTLAAENRCLEAVGTLGIADTTLQGSEGVQAVAAARVSGSLLPLLGVRPVLGRLAFTPEEERLGGPGAVILSHALWQDRFAGDPGMVGRSLEVGGRSRLVVGILPAGFRPPTARAGKPALVLPILFQPEELQPGAGVDYEVFGRLKAGVALAAANQQLEALAPTLGRGGLYAVSLRSELAQPYLARMAMLGWAIALLLTLTLANGSALLLARMVERHGERALQGALGASPWLLAREVILEGLGVGLLGALAGLALEWPLRVFLSAQLGMEAAPGRPIWVVPVALLLGLGAGLGVSLLPAWQAARTAPAQALGELGRGAAPRLRARKAMVVCEVMLSFVLLSASILMIRNLRAQLRRGPGFPTRQLYVASLPMPQERQDRAGQVARELARRLRECPGMTAACVGIPVPFLDPGGFGTARGVGEARKARAWFHRLEGDVVGAFGMRLLEGRVPGDGERDVALVSLPLARALWPGQSALGRRIEACDGPRTVVGVLQGSREFHLDEPVRPQVFQAIPEGDALPGLDAVMRSQADLGTLRGQLQGILNQLDPGLAIKEILPFDAVLRKTTRDDRASVLPMAAMALAAALLAGLGLHGLLSQLFRIRRREFGVRAALGASPGRLSGMVLGQGARLLVIGLTGGLLGALALARLLRHGVASLPEPEPVSALAAAALLLAATLLACLLPALRALSLLPTEALRGE